MLLEKNLLTNAWTSSIHIGVDTHQKPSDLEPEGRDLRSEPSDPSVAAGPEQERHGGEEHGGGERG